MKFILNKTLKRLDLKIMLCVVLILYIFVWLWVNFIGNNNNIN